MSRSRYVDLLRNNPRFRRLWLGEAIGFGGDWFGTIALYVIVQSLTDSAMAVALVYVAKTLPTFLVMPFAGPLADRVDRRKILVGTSLARVVLTVALIGAARFENLPLFYAALVAQVTAGGVFVPAQQAAVPQVTRREELPLAMAVAGGTWSVMLAVGAALGGVVATAIGAEGTLWLNALAFLITAAVLRGLPALPPDAAERDEGSFTEGLAYLRREPVVGWLSVGKGVLSLGSAAIVVLPIYGNGLFPATAGAAWTGALYASRGLGALVGSMGVRTVGGDAPDDLRRGLGPGFALLGIGLFGVAAAPNVVVAAVAYFLGAVGSGVLWVYAGTLLQLETAPAYRGRVFGIEFGLATVSMAAMSLATGVAMDSFGMSAREVTAWSAGLAVGCGLLWTLAVTRSARAAAAVG